MNQLLYLQIHSVRRVQTMLQNILLLTVYSKFYHFLILKLKIITKPMSKKDVFVGNHINGYTFLQKIGQGNFSKVYLATNNKQQKFAIKIVDQKDPSFEKIQYLLKNQVRILRKINNQNVIRVIQAFRTKSYVFLVLQYCNGGDLKELIRQKKRFSQTQAIKYMKHILNGFKGLHAQGIIHRDIKLDNILLHNQVCKIADFGFSKIQEDNGLHTTNCGTPYYMAPQLYERKSYDNRIDIWALGVLYYYMLYGSPPFNGANENMIKNQIRQNKINFKKYLISEESKHFIMSCLTSDINERITWHQIYSHTLFNETPGAIYGNLKSQIRLPKESKQLQINQKIKKNSLIKQQQPVPSVSEEIKHSDNVEHLRQKIVKSLQIEKQLYSIQNKYLKVRNQVMFPMINLDWKIRKVFAIKANHALIIFLLYKASYLKLKAFCDTIQKKRNFLNIENLWQQYVKSERYESIKQKINEDKQIVKHQLLIFKEQLGFCQQQIRNQLNVDVTNKKDFKDYLLKQMIKYWIVIGKKMEQYNGSQRQNIIRLLITLQYYIKCQHPDAQNFEMLISQLDYQEAEQIIKNQLIKYRFDPSIVAK